MTAGILGLWRANLGLRASTLFCFFVPRAVSVKKLLPGDALLNCVPDSRLWVFARKNQRTNALDLSIWAV